ncbi:hypothetical protein BD779DRAFT_1539366 [Infundibulicybe gibba]|nr:hypothetical protein BD779DRAFT_1539366 [Infundibulicybe gibba]
MSHCQGVGEEIPYVSLRNFDEGLFIQHPSEQLREEDKRLKGLDYITRTTFNYS